MYQHRPLRSVDLSPHAPKHRGDVPPNYRDFHTIPMAAHFMRTFKRADGKMRAIRTGPGKVVIRVSWGRRPDAPRKMVRRRVNIV